MNEVEETDNIQGNGVLPCVRCWVSIKDNLPTESGSYLTYIKTPKFENIGFTQFIDGEFMSSFVNHWAVVLKPCS